MYVDRVQRLGTLSRQYGFDLVVMLLAVVSVIGVVTGDADGGQSFGPVWVEAAALVVLLLPLLARRRFPFAAPVLVWVVGTGLSFVDGVLVASSFTVYAAGLAAAYLLGNSSDPLRARVGLVVVIVGAAIVVANDPRHTPDQFVTVPATFSIAWVAGLVLRARDEQTAQAEERAVRAEREREAAARVAVAEERARIARELHDIVAHAMSVMVLQVGAVRHQLPDAQSEARAALEAVEETGRSALTEMRRLLGVIRDGDGAGLSPQPGLDRLDALMDEIGNAGLVAGLQVEGDPIPLPRAIDLSAYRIIQEGLTNSLKHSKATSAEVTVSYLSRELRVEVRDDGVGPTANDGLGHGLAGIRERVKIYGGEMFAGEGPTGGYLLEVRLPIVDRAS